MRKFTNDELQLLWALANEGTKSIDFKGGYDRYWFDEEQAQKLVKKLDDIDTDIRAGRKIESSYASSNNEKYCIVVGRQLDDSIFWEIAYYTEKYDQIFRSQYKDEDKSNPEDELQRYFSMNKCYEIIIKHKLNEEYDFVVIKQAYTEKALLEVEE